VKTAISTKKQPLKSALKSTHSVETATTHNVKDNDAMTINSQNSTISQLTKQVSQIKMENKQLINRFDRLAERMENFFSSTNSQTTRCQARGHRSESGTQP